MRSIESTQKGTENFRRAMETQQQAPARASEEMAHVIPSLPKALTLVDVVNQLWKKNGDLKGNSTTAIFTKNSVRNSPLIGKTSITLSTLHKWKVRVTRCHLMWVTSYSRPRRYLLPSLVSSNNFPKSGSKAVKHFTPRSSDTHAGSCFMRRGAASWDVSQTEVSKLNLYIS